MLAVFAIVPASAMTVALDPVEDPAQTSLAPTPYDSLLTGCMEGLFSAGVIATNSAPIKGSRELWSGPLFGLSAARDGYVDYLVAIWTEWRSSAFKKDTWIPGRLDWRLVRVSDGVLVATGSVSGPADSPSAAANNAQGAASVGQALAAACLGSLKPGSNGGH